MKKLQVLTAIIIISFNVHAQGYGGVFISNKGAGAQMGFLAGNIDLCSSVQYPLINLKSPTVYSLSAGTMLLLTHNEADNFSITPAIGVAVYRIHSFTAYENDSKAAIPVTTTVNTFYSLQIGKDAYLGRMFIQANYCKNFYVTAGMKVSFNR